MKTIPLLLLAALTLLSAATAKDLVNTDRSGVAVKGYDPVAYFTDGKAVKGSDAFTTEYQGARYRFATADHLRMFAKDPAKYAPQFGGFCAWAVSQGYTANIDPNAFQIVDGRLLLQYSLPIRERFNQDTTGNLAKADANWPTLVDKRGH